jgi:hypothetical protein
MIEALVEALQFADAEKAVRVVVLTGEGSTFSSGGNLNKRGEAGAVNDRLPAQTRRNFKWGVRRLPLLFESPRSRSLPRSMGRRSGPAAPRPHVRRAHRGTEGALRPVAARLCKQHPIFHGR